MTLTHRVLSVAAAILVSGAMGATAFAGGGGSPSTIESVVTNESAQTMLQSGTFTACSANFSTTQPTSCGANTDNPNGDPAITASEGTYSLLGWGQVSDLTGLGDGWNVTENGNALTLSAVVSSQENPAAIGHYSLPTTVSASNPVVDPSAPSSLPVTGIVGASATLPSGGTVLSCGAGEGMGVYDFNEAMTYQVPASAYAGTYTTTLDVQVTENPPPV